MIEADIRTEAINALKKELSSLGGEKVLDVSSLKEDKVTLFGMTLATTVIDHIRKQDADKLYRTTFPKLLILTSRISKNIAEEFQKHNISYCDTYGNLQICIENIKLTNLHFLQETLRPMSLNLNTMASLKVILCLLQHKDAVHWPMRQLAETAGVSLGSVQRVMEMLKLNSFIFTTNNGRFLKDKRRLLDIWVDGFNTIILPKITLGHAVFRDSDKRESWQNTSLKDGMMWGGEAAAQLLEGYLKAEQLSVFTSDDFRPTVKELNIIPVGANGYISVLKKFWIDEVYPSNRKNKNIAPLLIVYAQLMGNPDSRCRETARRLLNSLNDEELSE